MSITDSSDTRSSLDDPFTRIVTESTFPVTNSGMKGKPPIETDGRSFSEKALWRLRPTEYSANNWSPKSAPTTTTTNAVRAISHLRMLEAYEVA